jgi:hypothetical protein
LGEKAGKYLEKHSMGYIDDPEKYQKDPKLLLGTGFPALPKTQGEKNYNKKMKNIKADIKAGLPRQMAALAKTKADAHSASMVGTGSCMCGNGLYAAGARGRGLYAAGRGVDMSMTRGIVGTQGGSLVLSHPAHQSQPLGYNFHQQFQLPPSFQHLHSGKGLYA